MTGLTGGGGVTGPVWPGAGVPAVTHGDWAAVPATGLVGVDGAPPVWPTGVRLAMTAHALWVHFDCRAASVIATMRNYKDKVWQEDAVEVYLKPPGDPYLYEFQLSPIGTTRDLRVARAGDPDQVFDDSWSCAGLVAEAVIVTGHDVAPVRWQAMFGFPWSSFARPAPDREADWRIGLFRIERDPVEFSALVAVEQQEMELHDPRFLVPLTVAA